MRISQLKDDCREERTAKDIVFLKSTTIQHLDSLGRRLSILSLLTAVFLPWPYPFPSFPFGAPLISIVSCCFPNFTYNSLLPRGEQQSQFGATATKTVRLNIVSSMVNLLLSQMWITFANQTVLWCSTAKYCFLCVYLFAQSKQIEIESFPSLFKLQLKISAFQLRHVPFVCGCRFWNQIKMSFFSSLI